MRAAAAAAKICQILPSDDSKVSKAYLQPQLGHWKVSCRQTRGLMGSSEPRGFDFVLPPNAW